MENKVSPPGKIFAYLIVLVFILIGILSGLYLEEYIYCYYNNINFFWQNPWNVMITLRPGHSPRMGMMMGLLISVMISKWFLKLVYGQEGIDKLFGVSTKVYKPNDIQLNAKDNSFDRKSHLDTEIFKYRFARSPYLKVTRVVSFVFVVFLLGNMVWMESRMRGGIHFNSSFWEMLLLPMIILIPSASGLGLASGTIEINHEGITRANIFRKRASILWSEVKELSERQGPYGGLGVVDENGKTVIFIMNRFDKAPQIQARIFEEFRKKKKG